MTMSSEEENILHLNCYGQFKDLESLSSFFQGTMRIFYNVEPSDVRNQTGSFAEAFTKHEERYLLDMDKVLRWRRALCEAANLSGWDLRKTADG